MDEIHKKISKLIESCKVMGINLEDIPVINEQIKLKYFKIKVFSVLCICSILCIIILNYDLILNEKCLIEMPSDIEKIFRPMENCKFCHNINEIKRIENISPDTFEHEYAYNGIPIIVTDATNNWTALNVNIIMYKLFNILLYMYTTKI